MAGTVLPAGTTTDTEHEKRARQVTVTRDVALARAADVEKEAAEAAQERDAAAQRAHTALACTTAAQGGRCSCSRSRLRTTVLLPTLRPMWLPET